MRNRDRLAGAFLTLLSLGFCLMAYQLGLGAGHNPGPGFAAFGIAFLLGLLSLTLMLKTLVGRFRKIDNKKEAPAIVWKKPLLILVLLSAYGTFFEFLGFPLTTFLLMVILVWIMGRRRLSVALVVSLATVISSYILFVVALGLPLPMGSVFQRFGG